MLRRPVLLMIIGMVLSIAHFPVQGASLPDHLPSPSGNVILTIRGDISHTNAAGEARFDRTMLDRLASRTIDTNTPWHARSSHFEGPLFTALLDAVGAQGKEVKVHALNGFEAKIPVSDFRRYDVILAMRLNGESVPIRDFGPLLVVYPFDQYPELNTEMIRFRSVWQVDRIFVY